MASYKFTIDVMIDTHAEVPMLDEFTRIKTCIARSSDLEELADRLTDEIQSCLSPDDDSDSLMVNHSISTVEFERFNVDTILIDAAIIAHRLWSNKITSTFFHFTMSADTMLITHNEVADYMNAGRYFELRDYVLEELIKLEEVA